MLAVGRDELFGWHLDAEVHDAEAVVGEDDLHQVLPDVVHVALDRGEDDGALGRALGPLHEGLEVRHGRLHRLGALQDLGDDQLVVVEETSDLVHPDHERAVDDVERPRVAELRVQVVDEAVLRPFDDVAGESLVQR